MQYVARVKTLLVSCTEARRVYIQEKLLEKGEDTLEELTFANLRAIERSYVHKAAQERLTNRALDLSVEIRYFFV